jgi:ribose transport system substrate-binding protein
VNGKNVKETVSLNEAVPAQRGRKAARRVGQTGVASLLVAGALVVGACGSSSSDGKSSDSAQGAGGGKGLKVGLSVNTAANPFYIAETKAAIADARAHGDSMLSQYADASVENQSNQFDSFIRAKVDFIVVDPVDTQGIGPAVLRAKQAGIPVVAIDTQAAGADATVVSDNTLAGKQACEGLAQALKGQGEIAMLDGNPVTALAERMKGCRDALASQKNIKVVATQRTDNSQDGGLRVAGDVLTAHPALKGMFVINDPVAVGAQLAAKQKGKKIMIVGVDGAKQAADEIAAGNAIIGTAAQDPGGMARKGLEFGRLLAAGKKVPTEPVLIPTTLVTKSNVASYKPWG